MDVKTKLKKIDLILEGLLKSLEACDLCPRNCGVNRLKGEEGFCLSGADPVVFSASAHHGEEPPLSGKKGSGTIFFSRCNMRCVYCQNYTFSQASSGRCVSRGELEDIMLGLQEEGCHNINLVSPTHFTPKILEALKGAYEKGLEVPIVYNTGGYDSFSVIRSLEGIVDVYLPDMRYSRDAEAVKYSQAPGYVENNRRIVKEMERQVGKLKVTSSVATSGLIVRLLVLPGGISGTEETLRFIKKNLGSSVYLSVMSQYYPTYEASSFKELSRGITRREYDSVVEKLDELGFDAGWVQPLQGGFDEKFAGENFLQNL